MLPFLLREGLQRLLNGTAAWGYLTGGGDTRSPRTV